MTKSTTVQEVIALVIERKTLVPLVVRFFLPFLALKLYSPIDGGASNTIFNFYYMEMLDCSIFVSGSISFFNHHLLPRGRKTI